MKNMLLLFLCVTIACGAHAQGNLSKQWDKRYGGTSDEGVGAMIKTNDGGILIGGFSASGISGDKSEACRGGWDYWIIKVDSSGIKQWDKTFGGSYEERLFSLRQTSDGGYILGGTSQSGISGDKTQPSWGGEDYWVVKTDSLGNKIWDKRFGGTGHDYLSEVDQTNDGGYVLSGYSNSDSSGDKTQHNWTGAAATDFWIVKIDSQGFKQWDRRYGGTNRDEGGVLGSWDGGATFAKSNDGGYLIGGWSLSGIGGDKTEACWDLNGDYWIIRIDSAGNKLWDKRYGGLRYDALSKIRQTLDGGFILGGTTFSSAGGNKTSGYCNGFGNDGDYWIIKIDSAGNVQWDKDFGSEDADYFADIYQTPDSGYMITGYQPWSAMASCQKNEDYITIANTWIVKLDSSGIKEWDKSIFGPFKSNSTCIALPLNNNCYAIASGSYWEIIGYNTQQSFGAYDDWLLKFCVCDSASLPEAAMGLTRYTSEICVGDAIRFVDVSGCYTSREWFFPGGNPSTSTAQIPTVNYYFPGYYQVTLVSINSNGTDTLVENNYVHVNPLPSQPFISQNGDTLISSAENSYQWYDGFSQVFGATNQTFVPDTSGIFHVCVKNINACESCSNDYYFDMTGINLTERNFKPEFKISPNPAQDNFNIQFIGQWESEKSELTIYNMFGEMLLSIQLLFKQELIHVNQLMPGIYSVKVSNSNNNIVKKLIIE